MKTHLLVLSILLNATISFAQLTSTFTDARDGKVYKTVQIGKQIWMAENLAYKAGSGCWAYGDNMENVAKYGYLYDFETAKTVCPAGWHLASDEEWNTLMSFLGENVAVNKIKSAGGWNENGNGNNTSGFSAIPGGHLFNSTTFGDLGTNSYWWTSTELEATLAWTRSIDYNNNNITRDISSKTDGLSVRCIKD
ncbi:MAG: FISUMP domain-containing protein [Bacteroidota bacterium]